ncbi:YqxA family protein [Calidifontibacillus oryziterrae]|uniref:YqxA family protein n=1 Tax=Calidifontibacillus oryziterrae TaxID=1191699 RepID=UPI0003666A38|nr:YqxA family protein [Calidifontibacillus oryziterrae]
MKRFVVKFLFLVITLFFGVLIGMQQVNEGLHQMKGFDDHTFDSAFQLKKDDAGEVQASILGREFSTFDIEQKQKKLEEMKAFHFFSQLGSHAASFITELFQQLVRLIIVAFDKLITVFGL